MKKYFRKIALFFGFFIFFLWIGFHFFFWIDRKQENKLIKQNQTITRLTQEDLKKIRQGDIILRRGYGFFSDLIAKKLNDSVFDVTHSGILYLKEGKWWVIHSLSSDASDTDGMQEQPLNQFLKGSMPEKIIVVRPKSINVEEGQQIVNQAKYYLERRIPFDRMGIIDEPSQMYCTELIWQILETDLKLISLPKDLKQRKDLFYSMTGTYDDKYFDIIINKYPKSNNKNKN
ncbi:YiiX/YebB-like N1pC/P60 family cysteine hydrolase [Capnocytophaga stomatis]|uniref:YiiX/YebB-like N1pC/P60 family cysteine hydrolase n=1 Tax=Capnocytophaga stomatis TaxID=1848904 RepID=A0ABW8QBX8_9FLAO